MTHINWNTYKLECIGDGGGGGDSSDSILITPPKGKPMPQTVEYYEKLAIADLNLIMQLKTQAERLKLKINQLRQENNQLRRK